MRLSQVALALAIGMAGTAIAFKRLGELCGVELPEITHFIVYAPALTLGIISWLIRPSVLAHWSIVLTVVIPLLGLFYGESSSLLSSAVIVFYILSGPALAALIDEFNRWSWTGRWLVLVNAFLVPIVFYLNYRSCQGSLYHAFIKFGYLPLEDGTFGANPNQMGGQLAFASLLGLVLFLRSGRNRLKGDSSTSNNVDGFANSKVFAATPWQSSPLQIRSPWPFAQSAGIRSKQGFAFGKSDWLVLLAACVTTVGCLMTGSRGAALSLIVGAFIVVAGSAGLQPLHRLRDTAAVVLFTLLTGVLLAVVVGINPIPRLMSRFSGENATTIVTAGSRLFIWENVLRAWTRDPGRLLVGAGTGGADVALGELDPGATLDDSGVFRRNCHNAFLEWLLSYGIVGTVPGALFVLFLWLRALHLDRVEGASIRTGLLATLFAFAMTAVVYRHFSWPLEAALVLASLCHHEDRDKPTSARRSEDTRRIDIPHPGLAQPAVKTFPVGYQQSARWPIYH